MSLGELAKPSEVCVERRRTLRGSRLQNFARRERRNKTRERERQEIEAEYKKKKKNSERGEVQIDEGHRK